MFLSGCLCGVLLCGMLLYVNELENRKANKEEKEGEKVIVAVYGVISKYNKY